MIVYLMLVERERQFTYYNVCFSPFFIVNFSRTLNGGQNISILKEILNLELLRQFEISNPRTFLVLSPMYTQFQLRRLLALFQKNYRSIETRPRWRLRKGPLRSTDVRFYCVYCFCFFFVGEYLFQQKLSFGLFSIFS